MTARVLVVDDVQSNLKLLQARLGIEYFEVLTATNGPDAIAICEKGGCDIVLLDVKMPGMDGFEVCRRLRTTPETAHLPIVLLTALDRPADRVRGLEFRRGRLFDQASRRNRPDRARSLPRSAQVLDRRIAEPGRA